MNTNPIIVIDDDDEDLEILQEAFKDLGTENEIVIFTDALKFLHFVKSSPIKTFFILCDINMSPISGLQLKKRIFEDEELRQKCVPFVFLSTSKGSDSIMEAYSFGVQGYFVKPHSYTEIKEMLSNIVNYWKHSQHPNL